MLLATTRRLDEPLKFAPVATGLPPIGVQLAHFGSLKLEPPPIGDHFTLLESN